MLTEIIINTEEPLNHPILKDYSYYNNRYIAQIETDNIKQTILNIAYCLWEDKYVKLKFHYTELPLDIPEDQEYELIMCDYQLSKYHYNRRPQNG